MNRILLSVAVACLSVSIEAQCFADTAAVNKYLSEATELVGKGPQFFNDATSKLELAEASMDDVPAGEKPTLTAKIDALKKQIADAAASGDKARIEAEVKSKMEELEGLVGNLVAWPGKSEELSTLLNDPKTTAALGADQVAAAKKQYATLLKVHQGKAVKENLANATEQVGNLEQAWAKEKVDAAEVSPGIRAERLSGFSSEFEAIERYFKDLPADNAEVKALRARIDKVKADHVLAVGGAGASGVVAEIDRFLETYSNEFAGMESETGDVTWEAFKKGDGDARSFNAKQTANFVGRVSQFLSELREREDYKAAKDQPEVKAKVTEVESKLAAGRAKIKKAAEALVSGFEKEKANQNNVGEGMTLSSQIKYILGENDPDAQALAARVEKQFADARAASDKADNDKLAYYKTMTEQANKAWPGMMSSYTIADGFDPNNASAHKGKYIKIVSNNLMGWRFKHGDFPYATKINGVPVAGTYDPAVKAALVEVEQKLGRAIGDNDNDGEWTAIARVEGSTGKLVELVKSTGEVTIDGSTATATGTAEVPVDSPIVHIVALKAGPVAVAQGQGAVKEDGSVSAPTGGTLGAVSTGRGFSPMALLGGLVAILVGAACLMKARFAPLATNAGAVQLTEKVGGQNLQYLGLFGIVFGAIGVLMNLLALPSAVFAGLLGVLASLAMVIAGGVASRDFFEQRGILPANLAPVLTKFAVPAGLACVALGALTILVSVF